MDVECGNGANHYVRYSELSSKHALWNSRSSCQRIFEYMVEAAEGQFFFWETASPNLTQGQTVMANLLHDIKSMKGFVPVLKPLKITSRRM